MVIGVIVKLQLWTTMFCLYSFSTVSTVRSSYFRPFYGYCLAVIESAYLPYNIYNWILKRVYLREKRRWKCY